MQTKDIPWSHKKKIYMANKFLSMNKFSIMGVLCWRTKSNGMPWFHSTEWVGFVPVFGCGHYVQWNGYISVFGLRYGIE